MIAKTIEFTSHVPPAVPCWQIPIWSHLKLPLSRMILTRKEKQLLVIFWEPKSAIFFARLFNSLIFRALRNKKNSDSTGSEDETLSSDTDSDSDSSHSSHDGHSDLSMTGSDGDGGPSDSDFSGSWHSSDDSRSSDSDSESDKQDLSNFGSNGSSSHVPKKRKTTKH